MLCQIDELCRELGVPEYTSCICDNECDIKENGKSQRDSHEEAVISSCGEKLDLTKEAESAQIEKIVSNEKAVEACTSSSQCCKCCPKSVQTDGCFPEKDEDVLKSYRIPVCYLVLWYIIYLYI